MKLSSDLNFIDTEINGKPIKISSKLNIIKLSEVLKGTVGTTPPKKDISNFNGDLEWINISDMGSFVIESKKRLNRKAKGVKQRIIPPNSLLYSFKLSVGEIGFNKNEAITNEAIISFTKEDNNDVNLKYFYYILKKYLHLNAGVNVYGAPIMNQEKINNANLIITKNINEQKQIAELLDQQQELIDLYIEKLSILEQQESYYQDELLSGRLRIRLTQESMDYAIQQGWYQDNDIVQGKEEDFEAWLEDGFDGKVEFYENEEWEVKTINGEEKKVPEDFNFIKVKSLYKVINGFAFKSKDMISQAKFPVIKMSNFKNKKVIINEKTKWTDIEKKNVLIQKNDLLMGLSGSVGEFAIFNLDLQCQLNQRCIAIRGENFYYIKNIILPILIQKHAVDNAIGGVIQNLSHKFVEEFEIPSLKDTLLISILLGKTNNLKELIKKKIKIEEQKMEYLMDELLSGRIRIEE